MKSIYLIILLVSAGLVLGNDLPQPKIVIVGQTGAGKSTLANVLLGEDPKCKDCTFNICDGYNSCTKETKYATGKWLGTGPEFTVVDTPGFGDSDNDDNVLIDEMMKTLKEDIEGANGIVLLINGEEERFDASLQQMMREMQALFGEHFWLSTIIGVSHWPYDLKSIMERKITGQTEEKFMKEWNNLLNEKFHLKANLSGVFIDSWSQQHWNLPDEDQQKAFRRETEKLWQFASSNEEFNFRTIGDVLEENQWLKDVITNNISNLKDQISELRQQDQQQANEISDLFGEIAPIGTILAWVPRPDKTTVNPVDIPNCWVPCDGRQISHGKWTGKMTPDLNEANRFLRGGHQFEALNMQEDSMQDHTHNLNDTGHTHAYVDRWMDGPYNGHAGTGIEPDHYYDSFNAPHNDRSSSSKSGIIVTNVKDGRTDTETRPKNMKVTFIMKVC